MPLDVLLIHEGKARAADNTIHLLPMGVISIADWLCRSGHPAEIVHLPIERALDPTFDPAVAVGQSGARLCCLDLHWHQQSFDVIEVARSIRAGCPEVRLALGGYTASAFDTEILEQFDFVDFVVRGDGEIAVAQLAHALTTDAPLGTVANLTYRKAGRIRRSDVTHVNSAGDLARFSFAAFERLRHHRYYTQAGVMEGEIRTEPPFEPGIFYCNCGRGCPYDCLFCGGAREAQRRLGGRTAVAYRPVDAMLRDLHRAAEFNLNAWYNTFHPSPDESYFLELFDRIRAAGLRLSMIHECLHLPSARFLESFAATFGERSRLDIVMLTGADDLRRRNKENFFSNEEVLTCLERVAPLRINVDLCYLTGLPFEREDHHQQSLDFVRQAARRFPQVGVNAELLAIEPLSAMSRDPQTCGIVAHARSFRDYYTGHREPAFVGYSPGLCSVERAEERAEEIREAFAAARAEAVVAPAPRRLGEVSGRELVQLHDVNLWDDGWHYGLGIVSLMSYAAAQPELARRYRFEHRPWRAGRAAHTDPTPEVVAQVVLDAEPRVVGFTLTTWSERLFREAARLVKARAPQIIVVAGGPVVAGCGPELLLEGPELDFAVHGYGELAFCRLLQALASGEPPPNDLRGIDGLFHRDGEGVAGRAAARVLAPHEIPSPYRAGLIDLDTSCGMHVEWSRGCMANCAYCTWGNALGELLLADRERILDDIAWAIEHGAEQITLNSSALNFRTEQLAQLCEAMAEGSRGTRLRFVGFLRYEYLDDEQLELLRRVPFKSLIMGLQTDDDDALRLIGRPPFDRKRFEWAVREVGARTRVGVQVITALPGDTLDRFYERLEYLLGLDVDLTVFPLQTPPGSRMYRERETLGIEPDGRGEYFVFATPTLTAREHGQCLERAELRLRHTAGQDRLDSHGVSASASFWALLAEAKQRGKPLVQLHHVNVVDAGMNYGLGVPFVIAHCRSLDDIAQQYELTQVVWEVDNRDRFSQSEEQMVEAIVRESPRVVGFSLQPWCYERFLSVIRAVKERCPDTVVVVGGPNASIEGRALLEDVSAIDIVVAGEGERPFAALLRALALSEPATGNAALASIGNLWARVDGKIVGGESVRYEPESLDYCGDPLGGGLVLLHAEHSHLNLEWTRGCPNQCTYCAWPRAQHILRRFSRPRIVADVKWGIARGFEEVLICDAAINYDDELLSQLCETLREADPARRLQFSCFVHWPLVSERHAELMAPVPWHRIMIGLQTDDEQGLRVLGRPRFDAEQLERCVRLLRPLSVPYIELITGVVGDTADKLRLRLEYALSLSARVTIFPLLATKGTRIHERSLAAGATVDPRYQYVVSELPTLPRDEYQAVIEHAMRREKQLEPGVLEVVGYHFLFPPPEPAPPPEPPPPPPPAPPQPSAAPPAVAEIQAAAHDVMARFARLDPARRYDLQLGDWYAEGQPQAGRHADMAALQLTFSDGRDRLHIDALPIFGFTSPPLGQGRRLAFVPAWQRPPPGTFALQEALRSLCLALAELDRAAEDEGASEPASR